MNPKISKLRNDLNKNRKKVSALQAKGRELEKQIRELEDLDIIGAVRESGMTVEEFISTFRRPKTAASPKSKETEESHEKI